MLHRRQQSKHMHRSTGALDTLTGLTAIFQANLLRQSHLNTHIYKEIVFNTE